MDPHSMVPPPTVCFFLVEEDKGVTGGALTKVNIFTRVSASRRMNRLCAEPEIISNTQDVILLMRAAIMRGECLVSVNAALFLHLIGFSYICMVSLSNLFYWIARLFPFLSIFPLLTFQMSTFFPLFLIIPLTLSPLLFASPVLLFQTFFSPHLLLKLILFLLSIPSATLLHSILPLFHPLYTLLHPSLSTASTPSISRHPMVNLFIFFSLPLSLSLFFPSLSLIRPGVFCSIYHLDKTLPQFINTLYRLTCT